MPGASDSDTARQNITVAGFGMGEGRSNNNVEDLGAGARNPHAGRWRGRFAAAIKRMKRTVGLGSKVVALPPLIRNPLGQ